MENIRHSIIAGSWYPGTEKALHNQINQYLDLTKTDEKFENVAGIVVPHAGYKYSGKTAAYAYNAVKGKKYNTIVIISPTHVKGFPGISIYSGDAYETPLGIVTINKDLREKLVGLSKIIISDTEGHSQEEHALEIQIPFLQVLFKDFNILPVVLGDQRSKFVYELADKLSMILNDETLIVASSDLSHYYPKKIAYDLDSIISERIEKFDYEGLQEDLGRKLCYACGGGGIVALMKAAELKGYKKSKVLARTDSGDVTGDTSGVVGYLAAVVYK